MRKVVIRPKVAFRSAKGKGLPTQGHGPNREWHAFSFRGAKGDYGRPPRIGNKLSMRAPKRAYALSGTAPGKGRPLRAVQ
jgi:hypothetical protein